MPRHAKTVIIGLDGATFSVLNPLMSAGVMPNVAHMMQNGAWGSLLSTRPPVTCPAWPSMFTGVGPGKHGVFSFSYRDLGSRRVRTAAVTDVQAPKLWDFVSEAGLRSAILNVPITFPAQPLKGVTLTGFVSPDESELVTYPKDLAPALRKELGNLMLNWLVLGYRPADPARRNQHVRKINDLMRLRIRQFDFVLDQFPCDLCYLVHEYTDRVFHLYYHILDPTFSAHSNPDNAETLELLHTGHRLLDESIGRLLERFGPSANYMIVSDHGFGGVNKWVYLNNLLHNAGLAHFRRGRLWVEVITRHLHLPSGMRTRLGVESEELWHRQDPTLALTIDYERTRAFGGPQLEHAVYINRKESFPHGTVDPRDYDRVRSEVIATLKSATDPSTGGAVFQGVWKREELFRGPFAEHAPDVLYDLAPGYMVSNSALPPVFLHGGFLRPLRRGWDISGYHLPEGVFIGYGPAFNRVGGFEASILDITPTALYLMDIPIPSYMDGKIIEIAMTPGHLNGHVPQQRPIEMPLRTTDPVPYSETEQREVTRRLEELGYL